MDSVDLEGLIDWSKDARGEIFWAELKDMFADGVSNLRVASESGYTVDSARYAAHVRTLEEVLQLPHLIVQRIKAEQEDAIKGGTK